MHPESSLLTDLLGDIERGLGDSRLRDLEERVAGHSGEDLHGAAVINPTAALQLALGALGLRPGERVLLPALIEPQLVNPVIHVGAVPVLVDVDPRSLCPDPASLETWIESHAVRHSGSWFERESGHRLAALVFASREGLPAPADEYHTLARRFGLDLVEYSAGIGQEKPSGMPDVRILDLCAPPFRLDSGALLLSPHEELRRKAVHWAELCSPPGGDAPDGFGFQYRLSALLAGLAAERFENWLDSREAEEAAERPRPRKLWRLPEGENTRQFAARLFEHGWTPMALPPCLADQPLYAAFAGEATPVASRAAQNCLLAERRVTTQEPTVFRAEPRILAAKGAHA